MHYKYKKALRQRLNRFMRKARSFSAQIELMSLFCNG